MSLHSFPALNLKAMKKMPRQQGQGIHITRTTFQSIKFTEDYLSHTDIRFAAGLDTRR